MTFPVLSMRVDDPHAITRLNIFVSIAYTNNKTATTNGL